MKYYPLFLDLAGRLVVVAGGGQVAERKVRQLLDVRANILVVSPNLTPRLRQWHEQGRITWRRRPYRRGDLRGAWLAIAASNQPAANRQMAQEADGRGLWINVVDDPERSSVIAPAWFRRGALVVAFSTGGASPALARELRLTLSKEIGKDYAAYVALLARLRRQVHRRVKDPAARQRLMRRLVRADLLTLVKRGSQRTLKRRISEIMH